MNVLGIIPARYASSRFPGKPLADIGGKPMIQRVYEQASLALERVCVATDDNRIAETVKAFGGEVVMTDKSHRSGTERCYEAVQNYRKAKQLNFEVIVNIQGDEPFINPQQIQDLTKIFVDNSVQIATQVKKIVETKELFDENIPKVVLNKQNEAIYFSRQAIPFLRGTNRDEWLNHQAYYKHIGIYAYRSEVLSEIVGLQPTANEQAESLEQLRWIDNGYAIAVQETVFETVSIDTPQDLERIKQKYRL